MRGQAADIGESDLSLVQRGAGNLAGEGSCPDCGCRLSEDFPTAPSAEENYKIFFIYKMQNFRKEVKHMLEAGIKGREEVMVTEANSAAAMGSGLLPVFATPAMVALMEQTSWKSVAPYLNEGEGTVGTSLNISHSAATPLGMKVWCESELTEVDRRRLVFHVTCYDEAGVIGEGTHERFIIGNEKFLAKQSRKRTLLKENNQAAGNNSDKGREKI